jgi:hypothetical protein
MMFMSRGHKDKNEAKIGSMWCAKAIRWRSGRKRSAGPRGSFAGINTVTIRASVVYPGTLGGNMYGFGPV